ncbi:protein CURLY FLAG LEAF 1-like isoform X2 [Musa acuminata AAA Group]|uniref:protein CURLY FLAG LEAF 1-like isoform X2 n=1 Tax=Musa acuminata AAA Group TaxID=214697 RepID=UPI0031D332B5
MDDTYPFFLNLERATPFLILYAHFRPAKLPLFPWQTGEVYYINRETGTRTSKDPRTAVAAATYSSSYHSEEDVSSDDDSCSGVGGSDDHEDSVDTANSCLTSLSSTSTSDTSAEPSGGHILVSAGCRSCFMYFMVPKSIDACPKCGGRLLKLGRDGCV